MAMKKLLLLLMLSSFVFACNKQDEATKVDQYKKIVYRINTGDSNLYITFRRAVYDSSQKGNIDFDSVLIAPGLYEIPATVLTGTDAKLYGESHLSGNFSMQITQQNGTVLAKTDSITYDPANQLHVARWYARINIIP
jgi:hypothetical protein